MLTTPQTRITRLLFLGPLLAALLPGSLRATDGVQTRMIFLTGHTEPGRGDERLWLPVDGVVPLDSSARQVPPPETQTSGLEGVADGLQKTLRLARVATRGSRTVDLGLGASASANLHNPGGLAGSVRLDRLEGGRATFTVRITLQSQVLASTPVTIPIGERAVVGALDGPQAPYVFLVIEARGPATDPIQPSAGTPATPLEEIRAAYTDAAEEVRVQGVVILEVHVDTNGRATVIKIVKGLPFDLSAQAQRAVEATPFAPATDADGTPIASTFNLAIHFRLAD